MSEKSEALRLADALEISSNHGIRREAAAELRRLWAENEAIKAERDEDRRREYGYSQQVVDALTKERDVLRAQRDALLKALDQCLNGTLIGGHTHNDNGLEVLAERCGAPHIANELRRLANIARAALKAVEEGK